MMQQALYLLSSFLFCMGVLIMVTKRHAIMLLMGIELIFNGATLHLVRWQAFAPPSARHGEIMGLFIIVLATCETAVGLAIIIKTYRYFKTPAADAIHQLREIEKL